jgi:N-acetylneuraminic acid mutarotase
MYSRLALFLLLSLFHLNLSFCTAQKYEISDIKWKLGSNLPEFRKGGCLTVFNGKVISVFGMRQPWGEMNTMYIYDPKTDLWSKGPNGPIGQTYVQGIEYKGDFYSPGGRSASQGGVHNLCYRLQFKNGQYTWNQIASMKEAHAWAPSASAGDKIFIFGGAKKGHGPTMGSVEMIDFQESSPQWKIISTIPGKTRGWSGAVAVKGIIYLIGGTHFYEPDTGSGEDRKRLNEVLKFNPETYEWEKKFNIPFSLAGFDTVVYKDRYIIVVGGCPNYADFTEKLNSEQQKDRFYKSYYSPFILVYDTLNDNWHKIPSRLPVPTNDIRVVLIGNKLYALGGENIEPATSNTTPWLRIGEIQLK